MRAAFLRIDVVRKRKEIFGVAVVVLERHFQNHFRLLDFDVDRLVQGCFGFVEVLNEGHNAALVQEDLFFCRFFAFISERDGEPLVQEGQFPQPLSQHIETELQRFKDLAVRLEPHLGSSAFGLACRSERCVGFPSFVSLFEHLGVLPDLQLQPLGQGIHDGDAHSM